MQLDDQTRAILEIESKFWRYAGAKEQAIDEQVGVSSVRYHQLLNELLDGPPGDVVEQYGPLINRLRRLRDQRLRQRQARSRSSVHA